MSSTLTKLEWSRGPHSSKPYSERLQTLSSGVQQASSTNLLPYFLQQTSEPFQPRFEYSKEELLALYKSDAPIPDGLLEHDSLLSLEILPPLSSCDLIFASSGRKSEDVNSKVATRGARGTPRQLKTRTVESHNYFGRMQRLNTMATAFQQRSCNTSDLARPLNFEKEELECADLLESRSKDVPVESSIPLHIEHLETSSDSAQRDESCPVDDPGSPQALRASSPHQPRWVYRDMKGDIQGPFTSAEMLNWYRFNFLSPDLLVRDITRHSDFLQLAGLIQRSGGLPFADSAELAGRPSQDEFSDTLHPNLCGRPFSSERVAPQSAYLSSFNLNPTPFSDTPHPLICTARSDNNTRFPLNDCQAFSSGDLFFLPPPHREMATSSETLSEKKDLEGVACPPSPVSLSTWLSTDHLAGGKSDHFGSELGVPLNNNIIENYINTEEVETTIMRLGLQDLALQQLSLRPKLHSLTSTPSSATAEQRASMLQSAVNTHFQHQLLEKRLQAKTHFLDELRAISKRYPQEQHGDLLAQAQEHFQRQLKPLESDILQQRESALKQLKAQLDGTSDPPFGSFMPLEPLCSSKEANASTLSSISSSPVVQEQPSSHEQPTGSQEPLENTRSAKNKGKNKRNKNHQEIKNTAGLQEQPIIAHQNGDKKEKCENSSKGCTLPTNATKCSGPSALPEGPKKTTKPEKSPSVSKNCKTPTIASKKPQTSTVAPWYLVVASHAASHTNTPFLRAESLEKKNKVVLERKKRGQQITKKAACPEPVPEPEQGKQLTKLLHPTSSPKNAVGALLATDVTSVDPLEKSPWNQVGASRRTVSDNVEKPKSKKNLQTNTNNLSASVVPVTVSLPSAEKSCLPCEKEFREWCKEKLTKLGSSEIDVASVLAFLFQLKNVMLVKESIRDLLGNDAEAFAFAKEFCLRKAKVIEARKKAQQLVSPKIKNTQSINDQPYNTQKPLDPSTITSSQSASPLVSTNLSSILEKQNKQTVIVQESYFPTLMQSYNNLYNLSKQTSEGVCDDASSAVALNGSGNTTKKPTQPPLHKKQFSGITEKKLITSLLSEENGKKNRKSKKPQKLIDSTYLAFTSSDLGFRTATYYEEKKPPTRYQLNRFPKLNLESSKAGQRATGFVD
ncbi:uncharacterized protein LOC135119384 [Zophobas morio]|uniref:uncharacterized protein LOC135119384 n=1 Tax=Zophobas morio TaxID=2755281 RepID=UPI003082A1A8